MNAQNENMKRATRIIFLALFSIVFIAGCYQRPNTQNTANTEVNRAALSVAANNNNASAKSFLLLKKKLTEDSVLQKESDDLLYLFDKMPQVPIYIVDEPVINDGDETERASAYTLCENKDQPTILVKRVFYEKNKQKHIVAILRHELVHAWFCQQGQRVGHDEPFKEKLKLIEDRARKNPASPTAKNRSSRVR